MTGRLTWVLGLAILFPSTAFAYVGPGLGVGAVAAILGVLMSAGLGVFAVIYYPVKRAIRRWRGRDPESSDHDDPLEDRAVERPENDMASPPPPR